MSIAILKSIKPYLQLRGLIQALLIYFRLPLQGRLISGVSELLMATSPSQSTRLPQAMLCQLLRCLGPPSLAAAPNAIRLRFRVTDADGLHQVRLHTPQRGRSGEFIACKRVNGTSATVEFVTTELSPRSESVHLWVIDVHGNFISTWHEPHPIDVTSVLPPATAVSMPDAQLAAAIRQEIGNITTHSLLDLRDLDVSNLTGITNLTGLEYAYNLLYFSGGENEITDVSALANLTGLRDLRLYANQISDITPLANLKNFERLVLYSNQISDITPLANLMYLMELRLSDNQISDITALTGLKNLRDLRLGNNQISDITAIANLTNLARLNSLG